MGRQQMTMRKCISSAPDQPRLILVEKRMLMGRLRRWVPLPPTIRLGQALGSPKFWCPLGFFLYRTWNGDMPASARSNWVSTWRVRRKGRKWTSTASREFNPYSGMLMLVMNGGQQQERLLSLGGCAWVTQSSHHVGFSCKGGKVIFVHLVLCNSVMTVTLSVLHL